MRLTAGQEVERIETRLRQFGTKLDRLASQAAAMATDAQVGYRNQIEIIKSKHTLVLDKLQTFRAAGGQKWESFRGTIELAWRDFERSFRAVGQDPPASVVTQPEVAPRPEVAIQPEVATQPEAPPKLES